MVLMDVCRAEQVETVRPPLVQSEKNIAVARRHKSSREVPSRYKAAITSSSPSGPKRCPSPNVARVVPAAIPSYTKRAQSAERRRPSTPSSSPSPTTTPVHDASTPMQNLAKRLPGSRTSEGLWPKGTMRSLCVSFQSDTFSIPITKKEKPVNQVSSDHTLKPSSNVSHRQAEAPHSQRKSTPERKRTPLRGRNSSDQVENSKPVDSSHVRVVDQHRSLSRTGGKTCNSPLTRSVNLTDKASKVFSSPLTGRVVSPSRRPPASDVTGRGLHKAQRELATESSLSENGGREHELCTNDTLRSYGLYKVSSLCPSSERTPSTTRTCRSQALPIPGPRPPSPSKNQLLSSSSARCTPSPCRTRPSAPFPSASSTTSQSSNLSSVLSFIANYKKGKRSANYLEDAHQLRILHNRYLQWRFTNAHSDVALLNQRIIAEDTLYSVWNTTSELLDSVITKRINLQQLRQELKLYLILTEQMAYLQNWALLEREHSCSFSEAITALEACTLRLPITAGAMVDIHSLKSAICSAADVMQAIGSSVSSLLSKVEETNCLVSNLSDVTAQEEAMVYECGDLLASTSAMQGEENSLRAHLIQLKQASVMREQPVPILLTPV